MESLLLLLSLGIQTRDVREADITILSRLNQKEWHQLRDIADKQAISALVFDGLGFLIETFGKEKIVPIIPVQWWQQFVLDWMGMMARTEQRNYQQRIVTKEIAAIWKKEGCQMMVFKGQANAAMYPRPEHRSPGDVDCYLFGKYGRGNDIARKAGAEVDETWYKHSVILYKGETFENHLYFVHTREGRRGKQIQQDLMAELKHVENMGNSDIIYPPSQWLAMFLTYHACAHFLSEGLRLKQVVDWAMLLKTKQNEVDWKSFYTFCNRNKLRKFADAMTNICVKYLGVKMAMSEVSIESAYSDTIFSSIINDNDYIFGLEEGEWQTRWHLVRNLFRYRWKYEDIYEESIWKQLWMYISGFIFHTE